MFEKTPINPELVHSIEQVYELRRLAIGFFCQQNWQSLTVYSEVERARSIVALVDVLKRADQLDKVLILSLQSNVLFKIQRSFELHTAYTHTNLAEEDQMMDNVDICLMRYEQFYQKLSYGDLQQFQLIILNEPDDEQHAALMHKFKKDDQHWFLKINLPKSESAFLA